MFLDVVFKFFHLFPHEIIVNGSMTPGTVNDFSCINAVAKIEIITKQLFLKITENTVNYYVLS